MNTAPCTLAAAALLSAAALLTLTACGSGTDDKPVKPSAAPTSAAPPADPHAAEKQAVLTAYREAWAAKIAAYQRATIDDGLQRHLTDRALRDVKLTVLYYQDGGTHMRGEPALHPRVTDLSTGRPSRATVVDCVDSSTFDEVDKAGKPVAMRPGSGPRRHLNTSSLQRVGGQWMITAATIDRHRSC